MPFGLSLNNWRRERPNVFQTRDNGIRGKENRKIRGTKRKLKKRDRSGGIKDALKVGEKRRSGRNGGDMGVEGKRLNQYTAYKIELKKIGNKIKFQEKFGKNKIT